MEREARPPTPRPAASPADALPSNGNVKSGPLDVTAELALDEVGWNEQVDISAIRFDTHIFFSFFCCCWPVVVGRLALTNWRTRNRRVGVADFYQYRYDFLFFVSVAALAL